MHETIEPGNFLEVDYEAYVQNLSDDTSIFYVEFEGQPPLVDGYLKNGFIFPPLAIVIFKNTEIANFWLYNPSYKNIEVEV